MYIYFHIYIHILRSDSHTFTHSPPSYVCFLALTRDLKWTLVCPTTVAPAAGPAPSPPWPTVAILIKISHQSIVW